MNFKVILALLMVLLSACSDTAVHSKEVAKKESTTNDFVEVDGQRVTYELIYQDVSNLLDVTPDSKEVFIRWEMPIRYYVEGLEDYPEKAQLFDQVAQEMAKITGLDIKRHDKIYWPSDKTMFHPDSPDNRFTNAHFFFYSDFEKLAQSGYIKAAGLLGSSIETERERFSENKIEANNKSSFYKFHFSGSNDSLMYFNSYEAFYGNEKISFQSVLNSWLNVLSPFAGEKLSLSISKRSSRKYKNDKLNHFDKLFLSTYYKTQLTQSSQELKHGINNELAAQIIAKELWHLFQQLVVQ